MKKIFITILLTISSIVLNAQKIDLDRLNFKVNYRKLAERPLGSSYRTFKVEASSPLSPNYPDKTSNFRLDGYKMVQDDPSFTIKFRFGDLFFDKTNVIERVDIKTNKEGKETSRTYYYKLEVKYNVNSNYQATTKDGSAFSSENTNISKTFTTQEYTKSTDASNYWENNRSALKNKFYDDVITEYIQNSNVKINASIGYSDKTESRILWITDSPKHPENEAFKDACNAIALKLGMLTARQPIGNILTELAPVITYFEGIKDKYKADEKPDRKLRYGAYFNLAVLYLFTDQPQKAKEMADLLIANEYDKFDGKTLKSEAEVLLSSFSTNKFSTTHFSDEYLDNLK